MTRYFALLVTLLVAPMSVQAWWNDDWSYRKEIILDTSATGAGINEALSDVPVLVRLHTGNFSYFLDIKGKGEDIRFIAADDLTPLDFHVEHFDPINEMALIWVRIPDLQPGASTQPVWMYYGNPNAVAGENVSGTYGPDVAANYHFFSEQPNPRDVTAYGNHAGQFTAELTTPSFLGGGVTFTGENGFVIPDAPSLALDPESGWTWSAWVKVDGEQLEARLFERSSETGRLAVLLDGLSVYAEITDAEGNVLQTPRNGQVTAGGWHHLALTVSADRMSLFIDGHETSYLETVVPAMQGDITVGMNAEGLQGLVGEMDEMQLSGVARSASWLETAFKSQGSSASLLVYGEDGAQEGSGGEPSYFMVTLQNVTFDGWIVIVALTFMAAVSWVVMGAKGMTISHIRKDNAAFQDQFAELGAGQDIERLDADESDIEKEMRESPLLMALSGNHGHFESSTLYRIYHSGVQEMHHRMAKSVGASATHELDLTPQAIDAIRATMDGTLTRENQKLNSQMVLLTIAISGGPFLGLLGTVVGVMITFAAIAASGDVNVNAIAPGIAAALVATVAGLAVAIPALFGYNYLGSRIKEISADMHVFVDEFVAKIAEQHS